MLNTILSISGKPGLFRLINQGRGTLIVESLVDGRRSSVMPRERVVSLGNITMYTEQEDVPLGDIFTKAYELHEGKAVDMSALATTEALQEAFGKILPTFDRERIYATDLKKFFSWYNILIGAGFTSFASAEEEQGTQEG